MTEHPAYVLQRPFGAALPIVVDSPHSGDAMPADFRPLADGHLLRQAQDAFVDRLFSGAPAQGAALLAARFPRAYIDPNRSLGDEDLVWRQLDGRPMYDPPLSAAQVQHRIETCWRPYHVALRAELDAAHARFGVRWHLDVHSMPDDSHRRLGRAGRPLADFVLGDRDGSTADEATMAVLEGSLRASGFSVARNDPFKGVEIVRTSGDPARRCHAVQVEVKRSLFMDMAAHRPHGGFPRVQRALERMLGALAGHARQELSGPGKAPK